MIELHVLKGTYKDQKYIHTNHSKKINSLGPKFPHIRNINMPYICNVLSSCPHIVRVSATLVKIVGSGPKDVGLCSTITVLKVVGSGPKDVGLCPTIAVFFLSFSFLFKFFSRPINYVIMT